MQNLLRASEQISKESYNATRYPMTEKDLTMV